MRGGADATLRRQTVDEFLTSDEQNAEIDLSPFSCKESTSYQAFFALVRDTDAKLVSRTIDGKMHLWLVRRAEPDTAVAFLGERVPVAAQPAAVTAERPRPRTSPAAQTPGTTSSPFGFTLNGMFSAHKNAREVFTAVFEELCSRDATFPERFAAYPHSGKRPYLARTRDELHPGHPDLARESTQLGNGWWLDVNLHNATKERIVRMACDLAGLRYGSDLVLNLGS